MLNARSNSSGDALTIIFWKVSAMAASTVISSSFMTSSPTSASCLVCSLLLCSTRVRHFSVKVQTNSSKTPVLLSSSRSSSVASEGRGEDEKSTTHITWGERDKV